MSAETTRAAIGAAGVVAIFRTPTPDGVLEACRALQDNGIGAVEITLTIPGALDLIGSVAAELGDSLSVGAGTVLDGAAARACLDAGASFLVLPGFDAEVVAAGRAVGALTIPGALTPTEVMAALRAGVEVVKVFPGRVATPGYVADLLGPLPDARLMPTGGITTELAGEYIRAGAFAVGVGGALAAPTAVRAGDTRSIAAAARELVAAVAAARTARAQP
jgi:2-dehydro-3-deoxyphosphogluconate aldolase/(4S)-4-hydroxy-2-oxoglutarate aldolase